MGLTLTDKQIEALNELVDYLPALKKYALDENVKLGDLLNDTHPIKRVVHEPVVTPARSRNVGGTAPDPGASGNLVYLEMTVDTDEAYRIVRIPNEYANTGKGTFHVHWTKSQNTDQSGKTVKWRLHYTIWDEDNTTSDDASVVNDSVDFGPDTYDDNGTSTRVVYKTADQEITGLKAGKYMALRLMAVSPGSGTPLTNPALVAVDFLYDSEVASD